MWRFLLSFVRINYLSRLLLSILCLLFFNACLLNPIVQSLLCPKNNGSDNSLLVLLLLNSSPQRVVELNRTWGGIKKTETIQLEASFIVSGSRTPTDFFWSSSDPSVATVDASGLVTGVGNGKVRITATASDGKTSANSVITVYSGFVYANLDVVNSIRLLSQNSETGILTPVNTYASSDPVGLSLDPAGKFLFHSDFDGGNIFQFTINSSSAALTTNGSVTTGGISSSPRNLVITPDGKYLYVASEGTQSILAYSINSNGTLTSLTSYSVNYLIINIQVSPSGNFLFALSSDKTQLLAYRIDPSNGGLTLAATSPTFTNTYNGFVSVHPSERFLYVSSAPALTILSFNPETGSMGFVGSAPIAGSPYSSAVHPSGNFYYSVGLETQTISNYTINPETGMIIPQDQLTGVGVGASLRYIIIDPTGRYAYLAENNFSELYQFSINQTTGALSLIGTVNVGGGQWNLKFL